MNPRDREDFRNFVQARSGALFRTALLLTGDRLEAEELLQDSLARACLAWPRIRARASAEAYVRRTMVNTRFGLWRRRSREIASGRLPETPTRDYASDVVDRQAVLDGLRALPRQQRAAVVLRYYEQLTEAETADALGISTGAVKSAASRGLARLRRELDDNPDPVSSLRQEGQS